VMPPFAVIAPTSLLQFADNPPASADLTDAWVSFESDQPLFAYSSIVDNFTADGTLIPAYEDTGIAPQETPPLQATVTFDVTLQSGKITISPAPAGLRQPATGVKFRIHSTDFEHGFRLLSPNGATMTVERLYKPEDGVIEQII